MMIRCFKSLFTAFFLTLLLAVPGLAKATMSLEHYLSEVKSSYPLYLAATQEAKGYAGSAREADFVFSPQLVATAQQAKDGSYPGQPGFNYQQIDTKAYSVGVSQEFAFGLHMGLTYNLYHTNFINAQFGGTPIAFENWNAVPKTELSFPLWQNFMGRMSKAVRDATLYQHTVGVEAAKAKQLEVLTNAQLAYWNLVACREFSRIHQDGFARAQSLLAFIQDKVAMDLRDKSDLFQVRASLESSRLDLQVAKDNEQAAEREFNRYLGSQNSVPSLEKLNLTALPTGFPDTRPGDRADTRIALAQTALSKAMAVLSEEKHKPDISVFGAYGLSGRNGTAMGSAVSDAWNAGRSSYAYGVRVSMPLNLSALRAAKEGAHLREMATENDSRYRHANQEVDWQNLVAQFKDAKERAKTIQVILQTQNTKLIEERRLLKLGRSSLFTVLLFEQDYLRAETAYVRAVYELHLLNIQRQLFSGVSS